MREILNELNRINCKLVLVQPDKKTFLVKPKTNNDVLNKKISLNASKMLQLLIDSDSLVTAIEKTANEDSKKWRTIFNKFRKDYQPIPYIQDAYDDLVSWLNAKQNITSAKEKIEQLQNQPNLSDKDRVTIDFRSATMQAYEQIAIIRRESLVASLPLHTELSGQINRYMSNYGTKKEAITSK
jgi:hypothetical protein